jgi:hypothetical protein
MIGRQEEVADSIRDPPDKKREKQAEQHLAQQWRPIESEEGPDAAKGKGAHQTDRKGKTQSDDPQAIARSLQGEAVKPPTDTLGRPAKQPFDVSCGAFAAKQNAANSSTSEEASPKQIQELMTLLGDPKVRNWLEQQSKAQAASEQAATEESVSQALDGRLAAIRGHLAALASTVPDLPNQFWEGRARVTADLGENGRTKALLLLAFFVGLGTASLAPREFAITFRVRQRMIFSKKQNDG